MDIDCISIRWLGNSGFLIKGQKVIYIDPYNIKEGEEKADFIFLTHSHYDHCNFADIIKIVKDGTRIIAPADCQSKVVRSNIPLRIEVTEPWKEFIFENMKISCLPAYNIDKSFHPKDENWLGYLIKINGLIIYHAGDTDFIPEMQRLTGYNQPEKKLISLLPVGGRFTMSVDEAVEAAKLIKPFLAVPMHYGSIAGSEQDAKDFVSLCKEAGIDARILDKE